MDSVSESDTPMPSVHLFEPRDLSTYGPLTLMRSVAELRAGVFTNLKRAKLTTQAGINGLWVRPVIAEDLKSRHPELRINESIPANGILFHTGLMATVYPSLINALRDVARGKITWQGTVVAAKPGQELSFNANAIDALDQLPEVDIPLTDLPLVTRIWELLDHHPSLLIHDLRYWQGGTRRPDTPPDVAMINASEIHLHQSVQLSQFIHLDASTGPIVLDADVKLFPFTSLTGPLYVGPGSQVRSHCRLTGSSISRGCNVGGEIKNVIMHAFSNKVHDGYLGDSILGSWVNLGANTNSSNLKNNYQPIRLLWEGQTFPTGRQFLGALVGDHTKTAIGTRLNTGTAIGAFANIFHTGFPPRFLPSFSWGDGTYKLERALETVRRVLARRQQDLPPSTDALIRTLAADPAPFMHW